MPFVEELELIVTFKDVKLPLLIRAAVPVEEVLTAKLPPEPTVKVWLFSVKV